jgi:hypothetical protein
MQVHNEKLRATSFEPEVAVFAPLATRPYIYAAWKKLTTSPNNVPIRRKSLILYLALISGYSVGVYHANRKNVFEQAGDNVF